MMLLLGNCAPAGSPHHMGARPAGEARKRSGREREGKGREVEPRELAVESRLAQLDSTNCWSCAMSPLRPLMGKHACEHAS